MKKICFLAATLLMAASAMKAEDASRAIAWLPPEFVESEWTYVGEGALMPGILDYFSNEYPDPLDTKVYSSNITPGDYWITPDLSLVNPEENFGPGPFIVHLQNPEKVWTDPIWTQHPLIFCFFPLVPEVMGIQGSAAYYGKMQDFVVTFPPKSYIWGTNPQDTPVTNLHGTFEIILPDLTGIVDMIADAETPVYYNLQGIEVANPDHGIYIVKQGGTTKKIRK